MCYATSSRGAARFRAVARGGRHVAAKFSGDGLDGSEDPRDLDGDTDVDSYEPWPPLDS